MDYTLGASVQNCICLSVCQECVGADVYVSACVNCTTCSFVMHCLRVNVTSPRQISMDILMSLANKFPCILVSLYPSQAAQKGLLTAKGQ